MNSEELEREWARVCDVIRNYDTINSSQMNAFFSRLQPQAMSEDFLMLTADNDFIKTWIELHYSRYIRQALKDIHSVDFTVAIEVDINQAPPETSVDSPSPSSMRTNSTVETQNSSTPLSPDDSNTLLDTNATRAQSASQAHQAANNALQQEKKQPDTQDEEDEPTDNETFSKNSLTSVSTLTFENFVIGASNRMAYSMAVSVAEEPGRTMLNPLFIYGRSGLGKTHLLRAIENYINETMPNMRTLYVDSADFLSEYVEVALAHDKEKSSFKNFKDKYQDVDVLLIDDIQYLQGKEQTLDIVFQIFNRLIDEGKQVVLSADRAPKNITMDERYQSRFNSGGTFDIQPPEVETKLGIIKSFVDEYKRTTMFTNFEIPEDVERYIAENSSSNIRELKSAVTKVIYNIISMGTDHITTEDVSRLLENHFSGGAMKKLVIADIQKQVELYYDVTHADLVGAKRSRKIVYARKIAIYLSRLMLNEPYNSIAKSFGGRDHTTIMYSVTNVEEKLKENRELREEIENIQKRIREM